MSASSSPPAATAVAPAVTSATESSLDELREAAALFLPHAPDRLRFHRAEGGVNNKCYFVQTDAEAGAGAEAGAADGRVAGEFVLRIYNNGGNAARVAYEHAVLRLLADKKFSFQLPQPLPVLQQQRGATDAVADADAVAPSTFALLSSGASACLFPRIRGGAGSGSSASSVDVARAIGSATAELVRGMEGITLDLPLPNPLYRNMYDAHHAVTRESFFSLVQGPRCDHVREAADALLLELAASEALIERIAALSPPLPQQQIHADLHFANVLIDEDRVQGVLDFEFSAPDWRCMELAVGLSKYIATPDAEPAFVAWIDGYKAAGGPLTHDEAELAPELIILRVLNNVIYFAGRALSGEDDLAALTSRMSMYASRCTWIRERATWMRDVLNKAVTSDDGEKQSA